MGKLQSPREEEGQDNGNRKIKEDQRARIDRSKKERRSHPRQSSDRWSDQTARNLKTQSSWRTRKRSTSFSTKNERNGKIIRPINTGIETKGKEKWGKVSLACQKLWRNVGKGR